MSEESALIAGAVISGVSALFGAGLNWVLTNVTASETARRAERSSMRESLETRYLSVITSLELFIRSPIRDADIDRELSEINAVVTLFGSEGVVSAFSHFGVEFRAFEKAFTKSQKRYPSIADAGDDFPTEWNLAMDAMYKIPEAMRAHIQSLKAFKS